MRLAAGFAVCVLLTSGAARADSLADVLARAQTAQTGLFGKTEVKSSSLQALPKWVRVVDKMKDEKERLRRCGEEPQGCTPEALRKWPQLLGQLRGPVTLQTLQAVNKYFNKWPYTLDEVGYGEPEYWALPSEFLVQSGDCEDYAITKFYALLQAGVPGDDMRIVALIDRVRNLAHAVLVVRLNNTNYVLDNLSDAVLSDTRYKHYDPQYSVNETTRWVHIGGVATK